MGKGSRYGGFALGKGCALRMEVRVRDGPPRKLRGPPKKSGAKRAFRSVPLVPHIVSDLVTREKVRVMEGVRVREEIRVTNGGSR